MIKSILLNNKKLKLLPLVVIVSTFSSANLYAHDDSCSLELESGLHLNETTLEFFDESKSSKNKKHSLYAIENDHNLTVHGKTVSLNDHQQALVTEYSTSIRAMVPRVRNIAIEGVDLALEGVNLAFNELLGEGNKVGAELTQELSIIKDEVSKRLTVEHGITLDENGEDILSKEFEDRIALAVEKAVMNSMGSLLVAMGQQMMSSDASSDEGSSSLATKMESFGDSIAEQMESRAEQIEQKADDLCLAIIDIDRLEEQLKVSITELEDINIISTSSHEKLDGKRRM